MLSLFSKLLLVDMSNNQSSFKPTILPAESTGSGNNAQDTLDYLNNSVKEQAILNTQIGGFRFHAPSRKHQLQKRRISRKKGGASMTIPQFTPLSGPSHSPQTSNLAIKLVSQNSVNNQMSAVYDKCLEPGVCHVVVNGQEQSGGKKKKSRKHRKPRRKVTNKRAPRGKYTRSRKNRRK